MAETDWPDRLAEHGSRLGSQLPPDSNVQLHQAVCKFEDACSASSESPPDLDEYLPANTNGELRLAALCFLVQIDADARKERGEQILPSVYTRRYPELVDLLASTLGPRVEVALPESTVSTEQGLPPSPVAPAIPDKSHESFPAVPGYELRREIGRGGMGVVFEALDFRLRRVVALKMILRGQYQDSNSRVRFLIEAEAIAQLQHPNVIQVFEFGQNGDTPFFALEYAPGGSLADKLKREGRFAPAAAAFFVVKLAAAMTAAHQKGIVHRDLKPGNILLASDGEPKVTDFGLAKVGGSDVTASGVILGTPSYMSPEQAAGKAREVGTPADVYALGAILYEMLTGRPPFEGETPMDTLYRVLTFEPVPPRGVDRKIPPDLETICLKCLEKDPTRRYGTAAELGADLRAFQDLRPISARAVGPRERLAKWARRHPARAVGAAAVLSTPLIAAAVALGIIAVRNEFLDLDNGRVNAELLRERESSEKAIAELRATEDRFVARVGRAEQRANPDRVVTQIGWRAESLDDVEWASTSSVAIQHVGQLRSLLAAAESRIDLKETGRIDENTNPFCIAISPDGTSIAIGAQHSAGLPVISNSGATVQLHRNGRVWKQAIRDGTRTSSNGIRAIAFSPDGRWLAAGSRGGKLIAWDVAHPDSPPVELEPHKDGVNGLAFTPDGSKLVSVSRDLSLRIWDVTNWTMVGEVKFAKANEPLGVAFSYSAPHFFVGTVLGGKFYTTKSLRANVTKLEEAGRVNERRFFQLSQFTPNGDFLVLAESRNILLYGASWESSAQWITDPEHPTSAHAADVFALSIDPSGTVLASGGADNYLKLWDLTTGHLLLRTFIPGTDKIIPAFDPASGDLIVAANRKVVRYRVVRPETLRIVGPQRSPVDAVSFVRDTVTVASVSHQIIPGRGNAISDIAVWDITTGLPRGRINFPPRPAVDGPRPSVAVVPGESTLLFGGIPGPNMVTWDWVGAAQPQDVSLPQSTKPVNAELQFAPPAGALWGLSLNRGETDKIRSVGWPDLGDRYAKGDTLAALISSQSALTCLDVRRSWAAVGSLDATAKLIRADDVTAPWVVRPVGGDNPVYSVAISPDERIVVAGTGSGDLAAFRLPSAERIVCPIRHDDRIEAIAFAPTGNLLATAGRDHTIRLWEVAGETFQPLITYRTVGSVKYLRFSADGAKLAFVIDGQRAFIVWNIALFRQRLNALGIDWYPTLQEAR